MPMFTASHRSRALCGAALTATALLASTLAPAHAHAAVACRADPVLWIAVNGNTSNSYKVQVSATVATTSADVQGIVYTVHAPVGTALYSVGYTGGAFAGKESVQFVADNAAGTFAVTTTVTTATHNHGVSATETVSHPGFNNGTPTTQARGTDGQGLATSVYAS